MEYVYIKPLPGYCREMVSVNDDGSYTIIINALLSKVEQAAAYRHAMRHINCDHFSAGDADQIEGECHRAEEESRRKI